MESRDSETAAAIDEADDRGLCGRGQRLRCPFKWPYAHLKVRKLVKGLNARWQDHRAAHLSGLSHQQDVVFEPVESPPGEERGNNPAP